MKTDHAILLHALAPEMHLVVGALLILIFDLAWARHRPASRHRVALAIGLITLGTAGYAAGTPTVSGAVFGGAFALDGLARIVRVGVCFLSALALCFLPAAKRERHPAEFAAILLFATCGFTLMAASSQLLTAFLAIELASLSLYILAGFDKSSPASAEAGLKYFLFGGMSAAFLLFGFSLLYGTTGSLDLGTISSQLAMQGLSPLAVVALVMVIVAFGFKAAAAPFHLWAPDVYQGAPGPAAALIAAASKLAGLVIFTRLLWSGLGVATGTVAHLPMTVGWAPVVAMLSAASLLIGNIGALAQANVRRLLAYSAIAHAGALLLGVLTAGRVGPAALVYYAFTYGLATVGAFGVLAVIEAQAPAQATTDLAGLWRRSPLLAGSLAVFILSLAGIPPLAGFFGKFAVFASVLRVGGLAGPVGWLVIAAIALSAVALYYYLLVLKQALVTEAPADAPKLTVPTAAAVALVVAAALLIVLGVMPSLLLQLV